jgi:carbon storage regulator
VLSRKQGERIVIGDGIVVTVLAVEGNRVKLGFAGPSNVPIHREEVYNQIYGGATDRMQWEYTAV